MRPRRPASPRPLYGREGQLDADEKRAAAISGDLNTKRSFVPSTVLANSEWKILAVVVVVAFFVRLFRLSQPDSVVFDEVHFGKFTSKYLKTQYYVDVHPPLAKLLITLVAWIRGFDGEFDFKEIAKAYDNATPYVSMRFLPAILGVAVVPLTFLTLRTIGCGVTSALLGASFILFENGNITQSRHILLDSPLIFFTALTVFFWVSFNNEDRHRERAFSDEWWIWLSLSGLSLGAVVSCKWVGLFTIATIGVDTLRQLWTLLGDVRVSPRLFAKHFLARALCLIALPAIFYMLMFAIHFQILQSSGDGDGFMSAAFQHTLSGKGMEDTFADISLGSEVSIRHINTQGGYLHSHDHSYPAGSHQQQITLYPHRDENNIWRIIEAVEEGHDIPDYATEPITHLKHGMSIRLEHITTQKRLHSHNVRPPVSDVEWQNEVSGYGFPGFSGDANDNWVVEIEKGDSSDWQSSKRVRTLHTTFRLRHALTGCYLFSHKVKLPEWAFEQQEVTCNTNAVKPNSLWYAETNSHPQLGPDAEKTNYRLPGFFGKFLELQQVMWTTNAGLTDRHTFDSRPESWPFLRRGINFWVKDHKQIYLIGNPFVWWSSTISILLYVVARAILILREKRGYQDFTNSRVVKYDGICGFFAIGWGLHYLPFFLMQRQLFLHHYFPALYFGILLSAGIFDLFTSNLRPRVRLQIAAFLAIIVIYNFLHFSPLTYGNQWTKEQCLNAKWVKSWDFSCNEFYDDYSLYGKGGIPATPNSVPVATIGGDGRAAVVVEDPVAGKQVADAGADVYATSIAPVVAPGHNVFEQKVADRIQSVESRPAPLPEAAPEVSVMGDEKEAVGGEGAHPLPLQPDDLVTTGDEEPASAKQPLPTSLENLVPEVESSASTDASSSAASTERVAPHAADPTEEDLERIQKQLYEEA